MAEDTDSDATTVATQETETTEEGTQQQNVWSEDELESIFARVLDSRLPAAVQRQLDLFQHQFDQRLTPLEQVRELVEETATASKRTQEAVREILAGTATEEVVQAFDKKLATELASQDKRKTEAAIAKAKAEAEEARKGQLTPEQLYQIRFNDAWAGVVTDLTELAQELGFRGWDDIDADVRQVGRAIPTAQDEFGLKRWRTEARQIVRRKAAARDSEGNARADVPSLRGAGGQGAADIVAAFGRDENPIPWSPKVAAAMKELGLS